MTNEELTTATEDELVAALAERVAAALSPIKGKVWSKGDHTRVYVRVGKHEGYVSILSSTRIEYPHCKVAKGDILPHLYAAGIVESRDISTVLGA